MTDVAIDGAGRSGCRSPSVEMLLRELKQMPVTEACASGLCDLCLYQAGLCDMVSPYCGEMQPSQRSGK